MYKVKNEIYIVDIIMIEIKEVESKKDLKQFIDLPWKIYARDESWVPPLKMAVKDLFNPKHPFYETAEQKNFLALKDGQVVGRISAVINSSYNEIMKDPDMGFWGFFESTNDQEVTDKLFEAAEGWLQSKGATKFQGPYNPSTNYECGLLVHGFDDPPQIMMTYNPDYYAKLIEHRGYTKAKDLIAYSRNLDFELPEVIKRIAARTEKKNKITYRFCNKKKFKDEVNTMLEIYNDAWEENWGFVPMTQKEFQHTAKDLKAIANERLIIFAEIDGEPAGFAVGLPDLNQVFKKIPSGNLFPFGIFKLLNHKKHCTRFRVPTLGIKKKFQKLGLDGLLYQKLQAEALAAGYKEWEASWILEDNTAMNKPLIKMGAKPYKTYRIFERSVN